MAWWTKMFQVERKCTHKQGQRSAECAARGWHVVDSHEAERDARADAEDMTRRMGVPYRATNRLTGLPL